MYLILLKMKMKNTSKLTIKNIVQTCYACPSQWEAETLDGKAVYIRYRHGVLSVRLGKTIYQAINKGKLRFHELVGGDNDGYITLSKVAKLANLKIQK